MTKSRGIRPRSEFDWDDQSVNRLRALWAEGHSVAEIGRRIGVSKNAVVGKAHRLNLTARPSPIRRDGVGPIVRNKVKRVHGPIVRNKVKRVHGETLAPLVSVVAPAPKPAARVPRPGKHMCRWPIGDPGTKGFRFCENMAEVDRVYCLTHCERAYIPLPGRSGKPFIVGRVNPPSLPVVE